MHSKAPCELLPATIGHKKERHFHLLLIFPRVPAETFVPLCLPGRLCSKDTFKGSQLCLSVHLPFQNVVGVQNILSGLTMPNICCC